MIHETNNPIIAAVREIAAADPDFVYTEQPERIRLKAEHGESVCSYVSAYVGHDEGRGCIIGQALMKSGVSREAIANDEAKWGSVGVLALSRRHSSWFFEADEDDRAWLGAAQAAQDSGASWGEAVRSADRHAQYIKDRLTQTLRKHNF